jgi:hypothetical protein
MSALALGKRTLQFISETPEEHWSTSIPSIEGDVAYYESNRAPAIIAESCGTTASAIEQIEMAVEKHKVQCVVVDYAQILRGPAKTQYERVTATSIAMASVARKHNLVVMLLCQLSRNIESRPKFIPIMSDIKETGQLEQDSDVILFLVWPHRINSNEPHDQYKIYVGKNRNRAIMQTCVECRFLPSRQMLLAPKPKDVKDHNNYQPAFDKFNDSPADSF